MPPKSPPFEFFATEFMFINQKGFFGTVRHFPKDKFFQKFQVFFPKKNVWRFLSLRYSADFRRSRLVTTNGATDEEATHFPKVLAEKLSEKLNTHTSKRLRSFESGSPLSSFVQRSQL